MSNRLTILRWIISLLIIFLVTGDLFGADSKSVTFVWDQQEPQDGTIAGFDLRINNNNMIDIQGNVRTWTGEIMPVTGENVADIRVKLTDGRMSIWSEPYYWVGGVAPGPMPAPTNLCICEILPQDTWTLISVDSQETVGEGGNATNAFDGNSTTFWHTEWKAEDPPYPHEIQIDLGQNCTLTGFTCLPRQDGGKNGWIKDYEFYVDGILISTGSFKDGSAEKIVLFAEIKGQIIKLKALNEQRSDMPWASVAEIKMLTK
jgi:hypothetical protein